MKEPRAKLTFLPSGLSPPAPDYGSRSERPRATRNRPAPTLAFPPSGLSPSAPDYGSRSEPSPAQPRVLPWGSRAPRRGRPPPAPRPRRDFHRPPPDTQGP